MTTVTTVDVAATSWRAIGCAVSVAVARPDALARARLVVEAELAAVDRACSRFRDDSDLSRVNRAAGRPVPVGRHLLAAVHAAVRVARTTGGLVDPLLGRAVAAAGYDRDFAELPADLPAAPSVTALSMTPEPTFGRWQEIQVDPALGTVRIPAGTALDLGSSAKAWAADRAAHEVCRVTGSAALVALGGDVAASGRAPAGGWPVRVTERPDDDAGPVVLVTDGGLATSGTLARRWRVGGRWQHHLLDPRTGRPADTPWRTVTVAGASCLDANAASTAAAVLGPPAPGWLAARALPARLVSGSGRVVTVAGWPADEVTGSC